MGRRSGLGRGLEALIPTSSTSQLEGSEVRDDDGSVTGVRIHEVPVGLIDPNTFQPRSVFGPEALASLTDSVRELGVLQPVLVRPHGERFELIAGERRWRAATAAGLTTVPALVKEVGNQDSLAQALVENLHREDLNPIEEAAAFEQLMVDFGLTQEAVAERVGKSRPSVSNAIRLLQLPSPVQRLVLDGDLMAGHARALLGLDDTAEIEGLAAQVVEGEWTVRHVEQEVRRRNKKLGSEPRNRPTGDRPAALLEIERLLSSQLDTRVRVELGPKRGRVIIDFADLDDLGRVYESMRAGAIPLKGSE